MCFCVQRVFKRMVGELGRVVLQVTISEMG